MKTAWRRLALVGGFSLAALMTCGAVADDPPTDEPPVQAEKPDEAPGFPWAYGPVASAAPVAPVPVAVVAAPSWVGVYQPGHVHEGWFDHILWYSAYHPFLDELHKPYRSAVYSGRHASYYAGYRHLYTPNWTTYYVPQSQCYAPGQQGYEPQHYSAYGPAPYAGAGVGQGAYHGPGYWQANYPGGAYPVPATGRGNTGFRYTGEPSVYSPYGVGSASYFGAYGSAGY